MPISFSRYIDITSGVGGVSQIPAKQMMIRVFTINPLLPPKKVYAFTSADNVGAFFGTTSEEYARAKSVFPFVSKAITSPLVMSFSRWANVAIAPVAYGDPASTLGLSALQLITAGKMAVTIQGTTATLTGLNFSADVSLAAVAATLQTALDAVAGLSGSTVAYNAQQANFTVTGPTAGPGTISFANDGTDSVSAAMGFLSAAAIMGAGSAVETITQTLTNSYACNNNFASFCFTTAAQAVAAFNTPAQQIEAATWNATENVEQAYLVPVTAATAVEISAALIGIEGAIMTLVNTAVADFAEMLPGKVASATNYLNRNSVQNYMYQQDSSLTPTVTDDADANTYDALRVNYYGQTQQNGAVINFYQTGVMTGGDTAPTNINVFFNEVWFKSDVGGYMMNLMLAVGEVAADNSGRIQLMGCIQTGIDDAIFNGTIAVGETLNNTQIEYIVGLTGDDTVPKQVGTIGYWYNVTFSSTVNAAGVTVWQADYIIIYAKSNAVNSVQGTHVLI